MMDRQSKDMVTDVQRANKLFVRYIKRSRFVSEKVQISKNTEVSENRYCYVF